MNNFTFLLIWDSYGKKETLYLIPYCWVKEREKPPSLGMETHLV